ncbi:hypothetical protein [Polyangium aurulentum]|uniref:hypothetical protein n=1 Tax=Polyangium aurulentum TaxID=2567896 RepID=UPI0010AEAFCC|nr:hypothetical protein [Polyangium aurulentum]UQA59128.1 hypothetical protein E8A73_001005 [Polyangium aurulentum]
MRKILLVALALSLCGCAGERDAMRKEVEALRQEVGRMRAENNILAARVETLELTRTKAAPAAAPPPSREDDRPSLDVVHLAPEAKAAPGEVGEDGAPAAVSGEEEDAPRPVLRSMGRGEVVAQTPPSKGSKAAVPSRSVKGAPR